MIIFNELRVTNDADYIIISARVRNEAYYKNVYIDKVIIDTEESYHEGGPSSNPVYEYTVKDNQKEINIKIDKLSATSFDKHLFFVYIKAKGTPAADTPCGMDNIYTLGVTMYMGNYYNMFMKHIKEVEKNCQVPQGLIDIILRFKALDTSVDAGHYIQAIKYFNKWFKTDYTSNITTNCGCHD